MILLGVTLGFIAENIHEHYAKKANAREYTHDLISHSKG
jgi:hypothetical protein